jgi:hypothetical protein
VGVLELLLCVTRAPDGALQLFHQGALPALLDCARHLLAPPGGGLLGTSAVGGDAAPEGAAGRRGAAAAAPPAQGGSVPLPGTLGAYLAPASGAGGGGAAGGVAWAPVHQQWCVLLSLAATTLDSLSRFVPVAEPAVALMIAVEPRVVLSLQLLLQQLPHHRGGDGGGDGSGGGGSGAPLQVQLASLLEAERSLALLCLLAQHAGAWQLARPGSLAGFRAAAAGVLEFAARPSLERCVAMGRRGPSCQDTQGTSRS